MHAPPTTDSRSISATRLPKYAACAAPFSPAGPEPITTKSNCSAVGVIAFPECSGGILPERPLLRVFRIATLAAARAYCFAPLTACPRNNWSAQEKSGRKRRNHDGNAHVRGRLRAIRG